MLGLKSGILIVRWHKLVDLSKYNTLVEADVLEQLEILRRIADRGLHLSESTDYTYEPSEFIDIFVHLLDEIKRTKNYYETYEETE